MKVFIVLLCMLLLCGCTAAEPKMAVTEATVQTSVTEPSETVPPTTLPVDSVTEILENMTMEEKVGQMFLARCNGQTAVQDVDAYHLGGFVLFGQDFENESPDSFREKLRSYQGASEIPLLIAVDEEGGTVTRVSSYRAFRASRFPSPRDAFAQGGLTAAVQTEEEKCQLLSSLGINANLGPVCDITTKSNAFMYKRSLGQDAATTADFVSCAVDLMGDWGIGSVLKHFPGYGNNTDTHTGIAIDSRSLEQLESTDLVPFRAGIDAGCGAILVSHTVVEALDQELPASLSPDVHRYLRIKMGFEGVIVTDDLVMQAVTDRYGAGEAAVLAVLAGNDLLCSTDYALQYDAVLAAVKEGRIPMDLLDSAAYRVLQWKMDLGLIK